MAKVLVVNGPNLNLLGQREPDVYGNLTLKDIESKMSTLAKELKIDIELHCYCRSQFSHYRL